MSKDPFEKESDELTVEVSCSSPQHHPCPPSPYPSPCTRQDFVLSEGVQVKVHKGQESQHDITLKPNPFKDFGTISGIVKDPEGNGIPHALVKLFDSKHRPFAHVFTNHAGQFLLCVPPGHYIIKAVK